MSYSVISVIDNFIVNYFLCQTRSKVLFGVRGNEMVFVEILNAKQVGKLQEIYKSVHLKRETLIGSGGSRLLEVGGIFGGKLFMEWGGGQFK